MPEAAAPLQRRGGGTPASSPLETLVSVNNITYPHDSAHEGIYCSVEPGSAIHSLISECPALSERAKWYRAPWWMANGHLLTVWAALRREGPQVVYSRRCLITPDGGTLGLDFLRGVRRCDGASDSQSDDAPSSGPLVLLCPGLGGDSQDSYVRSMAATVAEYGFQCAVLNMRGCGELEVTSPQLFSARRGSTNDLRHALSFLSEELPTGTPIFAAGWSNGGSILLNTLREYEESVEGGASCPLSGAVAMAVPYDMRLPSEALKKPLSKFIYDRNFLRSLLPKADSFLSRWASDLSHIDSLAVRQSRSLQDMEIHLISPMFGYQSVDEYYEDASTRDAVSRITLPTLCISALDDPIALSAGIPFRAFSGSTTVGLACSQRGGHIGWPDPSNGNRATWSEVAAMQFLQAIHRQLLTSNGSGNLPTGELQLDGRQ